MPLRGTKGDENQSYFQMKTKTKSRLDQYLYKARLAESREKARKLIMSGVVYVNNKLQDKPSFLVTDDSDIKILKETCPYVSRGGLKLEKAINIFNIVSKGKIVLDIGASTGGFTDCLLKHGASKVYAVDVGKGQLHWKLRNDPRVIVMEKVNARYLSSLPELVDIIVIDVSFISLTKIVPVVKKFLKSDGVLITLIKPQFEAEPKNITKGVVKNPEIHCKVIIDFYNFLKGIRLIPVDITYSPLVGPKGNIEFFIYATSDNNKKPFHPNKIIEEVNKAWDLLSLKRHKVPVAEAT